MSFWPWKSDGHRIRDIKAPVLAETAAKLLQKLGRNSLSTYMLYRALELDAYQPHALLTLSELYRGKTKGARPVGEEIYAGLILEYAVDNKSTLSPAQRRLFEKPRLEIMTLWGFVKPTGLESDVNHIGYMAFINESLAHFRSLADAVESAALKLAVQGGVLDPVKAKPTPAYRDWLKLDASTLPPV